MFKEILKGPCAGAESKGKKGYKDVGRISDGQTWSLGQGRNWNPIYGKPLRHFNRERQDST